MLKPHRTKKLENQNALTALLSTILLLAIAVSLVTVIYTVVLNNTTSRTENIVSSVNLVGSIVEDKNISFANRGGDTLSPDVRISITINQNTYTFTIGSLNGNHGLAPGETVQIHIASYSSLSGLQIQYTVLDPDHNTIVSHGILQEGEQGLTAYVQTLGASLVTSHSARLTLSYNFINASIGHPKVRIQFKTGDTTSQYDPSNPLWHDVIAPLPAGTYSYDVHDLLAGQTYVCRAQLTYDGLTTPKLGLALKFTTPTDKISEWNFDSSSGPVVDSFSMNTGILKPNNQKGPRYTTGYVANGLSMDGIDDKVNISDAASLHLTDELTIETWVKPLASSNGSFGNATLMATQQFADINFGCFEPDWISLGGQYYAIVCRSATGRGYLLTVKITNGGSILTNSSTCVISSYVINASCYTPKIIAVTGIPQTYAVVYNCGNLGFIMTIKINGAGIIQAPLKYYKFSGATQCFHPDIAHVSANMYTIVFGSSADKAASYGYIQNVYINGTGSTIARCNNLFTMRHDAIPAYLAGQQVLVQEPEILELEGGSPHHNFVVAYKSRDDDGGVYVININTGDGTITRKNGERKFDSKRGENPEIFYITGQYYGLVYGCEGTANTYNDDLTHLRGFITIIKITEASGTIHASGETASTYVNGGEYELTATEYAAPYTAYTFRSAHFMYLSDDGTHFYYAFSYTIYANQSFTRGYIKTIRITPSTPFTGFLQKSTFRYDQTNSPDLPDFLQIGSGTTYGLVFRQVAGVPNGVIKTLTIQNDGTIPANPIIDSKEIGVYSCLKSRFLKISDTICAMMFTGTINNAFLKTISVSAAAISPSFINSSTIEPGLSASANPNSCCYDPIFFQLTGNNYAVLYRNFTNKLTVAVYQIDLTGLITFKYKTSFAAITCFQPAAYIVNEFADVYLVAYRDGAGLGKLTTLKITSGSCVVLATVALDGTNCNEPVLYKLGNSTYIVAYDGASSKGELKTYRVSGGGNTVTFVDEYIFTDTVRICNHPDVAQVNQTMFALTYSRKEGAKYSSVIMTVIIKQNGVISKYNLDNLTYNYPAVVASQSTVATNPLIVHANGRVFAMTYKNNNAGNGLTTLRIGENGNITEACDNTLLTGGWANDFSIIPITSNRYIVGNGNTMTVLLVRIFINPMARPIFSKLGSYELYANSTAVWAKITDVSAAHVVQTLLSYPNGWNYIVVTYKQAKYLNLTVNANDPGSNGHFVSLANGTGNYLKAVKVGVTTLSFGDYNGLYDEFTLWASAFVPSRIASRFVSPNS